MTDQADVFAELIRRNRDDAEAHGTSWMPRQKSDHPNPLVGVLAGYDQGTTRGGDKVWIAKVRDREQRVWSVWLFGTVLNDEFMKKRPEPGEPIVLSYIGVSRNARPGQSPAVLYRLTLNRELSLPPMPAQLPAAGNGYGAGAEAVPDAVVVDDLDDDADIPF